MAEKESIVAWVSFGAIKYISSLRKSSFATSDQMTEAMQHVAGFTVVTDACGGNYREINSTGALAEFYDAATQSWGAKMSDTMCPMGPYLVTRDEVGDVQNLSMWLSVNGKRVQDGNTKTMIFNVAQIVSYLSGLMTLLPGDIITTGTPPGVGLGQKPEPWYLKAGDVVELGIEKLGEQRQDFVAWEAAR